MALNPQYIVSINLQEYLVDKDTGLPLSAGYIEFWQDSSRTTPKTVYQLTGNPPNYTYTALSNPVGISAVGVPVDANGNQVHIYYYPYDDAGVEQLYYVAVYSEGGVLQYTLQGWPNVTPSTNPSVQSSGASNQLANSQFVDVLFDDSLGMTITFDTAVDSLTYEIAPGWEIIISSSGAGSLIINRDPLEGILNVVTNPPFQMTFQPEGNTITDLILRQTLDNNPDIWSSTSVGEDGYIAGMMLVSSLDGQTHIIEMQYTQSDGTEGPQTIVIGTTGITGYRLLENTVLLNTGANTDDGNNGAVYIDIVLPNQGYYSLTSVQVVGLNNEDVTVAYEQQPANRQKSQLFYYYQPEINFKPIKSYLTGWDFPLNPAQFSLTATLGAYASNYMWDQTIGFQSVNSALTYGRYSGAGPCFGSLQITAAATAQFAVIQYLKAPQIIDILTNPLSSNIVLTSDLGGLIGTISIYYTTDAQAPNTSVEHESIVQTLDENGYPLTFNGTWTEIPRPVGNAQFTLSSLSTLNELQSFGFSGWQLDDFTDLNTATHFAIVVGFAELTSSKNICIQSCSLVPGYIPTIPAPQTANEVLDDSEYYYEKSYDTGTLPGTATQSGVKFALMDCFYNVSTTNSTVFANPFSLEYKKPKISTAVNTFYSYLSATAGNDFVIFAVSNNSYPAPTVGANPYPEAFSTFFVASSTSLNNTLYIQNSNATLFTFNAAGPWYTAGIRYHYTADARIGVYTP